MAVLYIYRIHCSYGQMHETCLLSIYSVQCYICGVKLLYVSYTNMDGHLIGNMYIFESPILCFWGWMYFAVKLNTVFWA